MSNNLVSHLDRCNGMITISPLLAPKVTQNGGSKRYIDEPLDMDSKINLKDHIYLSSRIKNAKFIYSAVSKDGKWCGGLSSISDLVKTHIKTISWHLRDNETYKTNGFTVSRHSSQVDRISIWNGDKHYNDLTVNRFCRITGCSRKVFSVIKKKSSIQYKGWLFSIDGDIKETDWKSKISFYAVANDRLYFGTGTHIARTLKVEKEFNKIRTQFGYNKRIKIGNAVFYNGGTV
ncbi:MAG: hypothetical protein GY928_21460 [Colwellia sp.]|nr:hypothetical protein [Colwellia sp.]